MLDRLAAGLVSLPAATYDLVLVLTDTDGSRRAEAAALLVDRAVWARLVPAIAPGGKLSSEDGSFGGESRGEGAEVRREAVLAGLVVADAKDGFVKPDYAEEEVVPLRFGLGKKKRNNTLSGSSSAGPAVGAVTVSVGGKKEELGMVPPVVAAAATGAPAGVGFIDFSDDLDLDAEDDDEVIDEDTLLTEEDLRRPIQQPPECAPEPGKKRRACKDWYCPP